MRPKNAKLNMVRLLSSLLASVLLMTLLAVLFAPSVFADETTPPEDNFEILPDYDPDAEKIDWDSVATSGTCGEKLTWSYSGGTLTIEGEGAMEDFLEVNMAPWYPLRSVIHRVSFPEKLTSIGMLAFYGCTKLKMVVLPDGVSAVGNYAFSGCENLTTIHLGTRLVRIGRAAFYACLKLRDVRLPYTLISIGEQAFYRCESLVTMTIPTNVASIGASVFAYCKNLIRVEISAKLKSLPSWSFYGCELLTIIVLPDTLQSVESYAFRKCDVLSTVFFDGKADKKNEINRDIIKDIPIFDRAGYISGGLPSPSSTAGKITVNDNGTITQESTTVRQDNNMTMASKVEHTHSQESAMGGSYTVDIKITVENNDIWQDMAQTVNATLKNLHDTYTRNGAEAERVDVTLYLKTQETVDETFVEEMAGRDVKVTVVSQNGSEFRVDCSDLKKEELSGDYNYSYSVDSATQESQEALGTDNCYKVTFDESAKINAEVVIPLPENKGNSNAFLYQVERDGTHTRLQAVAVDDDGNAHFYLGAVDKDTEYVIGVNVPNETTDDVIIPDELFPKYGTTENAIVRLEKIDYVVTGRKSSWGLGAMQVTWIMLAVIAVCIVVVGVIMAIWNKRRLERGYVPEIDYEAEEM